MGRPTKYSKALSLRICSRLACGESMRSLARDPKMPAMSTMFSWLSSNRLFSEQYARAKRESADALFEDIIDIVDNDAVTPILVDGIPLQVDGKILTGATAVSIAHARLRMDARKWAASKLQPKKYGDKLELLSEEEESPPLTITFNVNPAVDDIKITNAKP